MSNYYLVVFNTFCNRLIRPACERMLCSVINEALAIRHYVDRTGVDFYCAILIMDLIVFGYVGFTCINKNFEYVVAYRCISYVCEG